MTHEARTITIPLKSYGTVLGVGVTHYRIVAYGADSLRDDVIRFARKVNLLSLLPTHHFHPSTNARNNDSSMANHSRKHLTLLFLLLSSKVLGFSLLEFSTRILSNWSQRAPTTANSIVKERTALLKAELFNECQRRDENPSRERIESIIDELATLSPVKATAASPLLQRKWMLLWTTEKEINFFIEKGICPEGSIYQTIDGEVLGNMIPFRSGGGFGVQGSLSIPDENGPRTNFAFTTALLDLGKWGKYTLPPLGSGWFDTIFLDDKLRIDRNSRNDILICIAEE